MSKKTIKTINFSIDEILKDLIEGYIGKTGQTTAEYMRNLIRDDLISKKILKIGDDE